MRVHLVGLSLALVLLLSTAVAAPSRRQGDVTVLSEEQVATWTVPAYFASAAYCPGNTVQAWDCGAACGNVTSPSGIVTGGNGEDIPRWFVASTRDTIIVSISGTNTSSPESIAIDLDFPLVDIDQNMFPGSNGAKLHRGFYRAFERMQEDILTAINGQAGQEQILVVGHSLGAALTQIMAAYFQKQFLNSTITAKGFAPPRSGNDAWADYVDATLGSNTAHMINFADVVPHLPPRPWGYQHASGEVFISKDGQTYEACAGQENKACADSLETPLGEVVLVLSFIDDLDVDEHRGPYAGVMITSNDCTQ